jgi:hypothetical protein
MKWVLAYSIVRVAYHGTAGVDFIRSNLTKCKLAQQKDKRIRIKA